MNFARFFCYGKAACFGWLLHNYVLPSGIDEVKTTSAAPAYYDLQGRRINCPSAHGIYIVNGKKIMR